eukprot:1832979-Amphidinium_carterae.1
MFWDLGIGEGWGRSTIHSCVRPRLCSLASLVSLIPTSLLPPPTTCAGNPLTRTRVFPLPCWLDTEYFEADVNPS